MSLLPLISKLSIEGRSSTATTSVPPSRRSSTSRKKPVSYMRAQRFGDAALVELVADVHRQVVVDRAFGDALQAFDADVADREARRRLRPTAAGELARRRQRACRCDRERRVDDGQRKRRLIIDFNRIGRGSPSDAQFKCRAMSL